MKKLGLDIDGTITPPETFIPYLNQHFQKDITLDDITNYDLTKLLGISTESFFQWLSQHEKMIYEQASIANYALEALIEWQIEHQMVYISARGNHLAETTQKWFDHHNIPHHQIELIGKHNKIEAIKEHELDIFFEDKHDNACEIAEQCNIPVILIDTPYNRNPVPNNVIRVNDWKEAKRWTDDWMKK